MCVFATVLLQIARSVVSSVATGGSATSMLVGKAMFLAGCTRPDIMQAVAALDRYLAIPRESHWRAAKHVLRYLHGTAALDLRYHGPNVNVADGSATGELHFEGFADANHAGCKDTLRSTTGQVFRMNGAAVSWSSALQPTVAQSTTEAEYMQRGNLAPQAASRHTAAHRGANPAAGGQSGGSCTSEKLSATCTD
jgi:hypothetical protein